MGGEIRLNSKATGINTSGGRVVSVEVLSGGATSTQPTIISVYLGAF